MQRDKTQPSNSKAHSSAENEMIYSEDGVDLTLIRWMLSLTPTERLQILQQAIHGIMRLRGDHLHT